VPTNKMSEEVDRNHPTTTGQKKSYFYVYIYFEYIYTSIGWQNEDPIMPYFLHGCHFSLFKYNYYFTIQRENILYTSIGWQNEDPIMPYFLHGCHFSFFNNKIICI
jgi:hypothetical protein